MRIALECLPSIRAELVNAALDTAEPAIDIVDEDLADIRHAAGRPHRSHPHPAAFEELSAAQRLLAVGSDDPDAAHAAGVVVPNAPCVLAEQERGAALVLARPVRQRVEHDLDGAVDWRCRIDGHQAEAKATAELAHRAVVRRGGLAAVADAARHGKIDGIAERQALDALEHERQVEAQLQLDDDERFLAASRDEIAAPDLALDVVALPLEEALHRQIEICLARHRPRSIAR